MIPDLRVLAIDFGIQVEIKPIEEIKMPHGGRREGAGRKRGSRLKNPPRTRSAITAMEAAAAGLTPVDYLLGIMRNETLDMPVRLDAAKAVAPYVHPRLASIEARVETMHTMPDELLTLRLESGLDRLDRLPLIEVVDDDASAEEEPAGVGAVP
jgi:hypothetical protein